jgi:hypothetical protein
LVKTGLMPMIRVCPFQLHSYVISYCKMSFSELLQYWSFFFEFSYFVGEDHRSISP